MARPMKTLERLLFAIGAALIVFYVGVLAFRAVGSRLAVQSFEAAKESQSKPESAPRPKVAVELPSTAVDVRRWAVKRIAAYRESLGRQFAPPLAVLRAPSVGIETPVFDGTDELVLNRGAGRIVGTSRPGEAGNVGIAGHRDGFFRALKGIAIGDTLTLDTGASTDVYVVKNITIVDKTDVSVLAQTTQPSMTLVTCYPFYYLGDAPRRYIVECALKDRRHNAGQVASP